MPTIDTKQAFALGFFVAFGAVLIANYVPVVCRACWPPISRWTRRHILFPRLFRGQHIFNPTRIALLCHLSHWTAAIIYDTWDVDDASRAAFRAGQLAVINLVVLLTTYQLGFMLNVLGLSWNVIGTIHQSLAFMALIQSIMHSVIHLQTGEKQIKSMVSQAIAAASLLALSILPLTRRYGYEIFLWLHRATAIAFLIALWWHIGSSQSLGGILLVVVFGGLLASTIFQSLNQLYKNTEWDRRGVSIVRTMTARKSGTSVTVKIQLRRPWKIQPGEFIYFRLLTLRSASIFQRHPFVITWWEGSDVVNERDQAKRQQDDKITGHKQNNARKAQVIYVVIDPQRGWTRHVTSDESVFENQIAWLDGPFGPSYRLEQYSTVVLFASGHGIFAQLPFLRDLTIGLNASTIRTRRVKLVWQAESSNEQLQEWMHEILRDEQLDNDVLDICIHAPIPAQQLETHQYLKNHKIYQKSRCVKIVYDVPDVEGYLQRELKDSKISTAVTGKRHIACRCRNAVGSRSVMMGHAKLLDAEGGNIFLMELAAPRRPLVVDWPLPARHIWPLLRGRFGHDMGCGAAIFRL